MTLKVTLKWKIFIGGIGLSLSIVVLNVFYATHVIHRAAARGHELAQTLRRYETFQRNASNGQAAALEAWSHSDALTAALGRGDDAAAHPLIEKVETELKEDLRPDFLVVVDKHGDVHITHGSPVTDADVRTMALFADLKAGRKVKDAILVHKGRAYLVNGVPFVRDGANVGSMTVGTRLERLLHEFSDQSDEDARRQADLALVTGGGVAVSASLPEDEWPEFSRAAVKDPPDLMELAGTRTPVLMLRDGAHDFAKAVKNGYDGNNPGFVGTLYAARNRMDYKALIDRLIRDHLVVAFFAVLFGFIMSFILASAITRPIKKLIEATDEIAHGTGDLTKRLTVVSRDELGELAHNLNAMFENLHRLAAEVQHASQEVGGSSGEISAASKQMLAGAKEQAVKIESSTAAVTELSSSIQQVADNAMQATRVAKESGDNVQEAIDGMARIRHTVDSAAEKIHDLGESGKRIGNIVEVIRQISEQTSLLALNASIEAAHAGEQGRGFAVVADEVSSLARRVGQSAKDIEDLIATIKDQTAEAVTSMQAGTREVESGTKIVVQTLQSLRRIIEVIQDTATAVQEQAVVSDEIARNMDAVQKIAQEVLASSEAAVQHGDTLHDLSHALEESVRGFRTSDDEREERPGHGSRAAREEAPRLVDAAPRAALPSATRGSESGRQGERRRVARG